MRFIERWLNPLSAKPVAPPDSSQPTPPPLPPKPALCPECKSPYHVVMMPIHQRGLQADGSIVDYAGDSMSVACFECGQVYGIVQGVGVVTRKVINPSAGPQRAPLPGEQAKQATSMLDKVMGGMKWRQPDPRTP